MKLVIRKRKIYDDNTYSSWKRHSSKTYLEMQNAFQALNTLGNTHYHWCFDYDIAKMWKWEFRIEEKIDAICPQGQ